MLEKFKQHESKYENVGRKKYLLLMTNLDCYTVLYRNGLVTEDFDINIDYIKPYDELKDVDKSFEDNLYSEHGNTHREIYNGVKKDDSYDDSRFIADLVNSIGVCVVSGNVRRSAEIAVSSVRDDTFRELKNYNKYPERTIVGWMSNNSCLFEKSSDFKEYIPKIVDNIFNIGEPGLINMVNIKNFGRVAPHEFCKNTRESEPDYARLTNPCGEIPLESYELCNLVEVFPTRCVDENGKFNVEIFNKSLEYATFYSSTVALLPTHYEVTNSVIARNRRIGVSLSGVALFYDNESVSEITRYLRDGYKIIRNMNKLLAKESGVAESIRVTTIKPSGTISLLSGVPPGMHFPPFRYAIRRVRIAKNNDISDILIKNGVYYEQDLFSDNTLVFEFPIDHGDVRPSEEITPWEQFSILSLLQREWSDNMVSSTITFDKNKTTPLELEKAIAAFSPLIKSCSLLPHSDTGAYKQMPYEGITKEVYLEKLSKIKRIDWSELNKNNEIIKGDIGMPKYCDGISCEL